MFRNKGIIGLGIVLAFFILISLIFSDIWLENELENMGDQIVGAKVEIDNLNLSFTELNLSWGRLQVTNPENTMKNMFETGECKFDLELLPLLSNKVTIEDFKITDIKTNTERETDGKISKEELAQKETFITRTAQKLQQNVETNVGMQFTKFAKKVNVDSLLKLLDIQSIEQISNLQNELTLNFDNWENRFSEVTLESDLKKIEAQIKAIDINKINTVERFQSALTDVNEIKTSLDSIKKFVGTLQNDVSDNIKTTQNSLSRVDNWIQDDYSRAMSLAKLPEINAQNIGKLLFGANLVDKVNQYLSYLNTARKYANKIESEKPEKENPPRLKGQDIYFYNKNARPDFWIRNLLVSGQTENKLQFKGDIKNIVSDQRLIGATTDILIQGSKEDGANLEFEGILNYLGDEPTEQFVSRFSGFSLANTTLSKSQLLPNKIASGVGNVQANLLLGGKTIAADINFQGDKLRFEDNADEVNKFEETIQSIVQGISDVNFIAKISGEQDNLAFNLKSNLDDIFVKQFQAIVGKEVESAKQKIKEKIDSEVDEHKIKLNSLINEKENQLKTQLGKYQNLLEDKLNLANAKEKEIKDRIEQEKSKLEDAVLDILKF